MLCGVSGGVKYRISGTNKHLYMGFTNPATGSYKNFIAVNCANEPAKYAYDNSHDDTVKVKQNEGFRLKCTMRKPKLSPYKLFEYTIREN